ncbi:MAG: amidohydrolase family protein [Eubacteriales bacterium]|nr:amidohydrolase family protein [Eubacteriales bacterium]
MNQNRMILKGNICYSRSLSELRILEPGYLLCEDGICRGALEASGGPEALSEEWRQVPVTDYGGCLIIPGMTDLHLHAPQYEFRGMGMDMELLDWLEQYAFPAEAGYAKLSYADRAYEGFVEDLKASFTTRACMFATIHRESAELLMEKLDKAGLAALVGKVNMDRNSPDILREKSPEESAEQTVQWLERTAGRFLQVKPILTPRFIPSCSDGLMERLRRLQKAYRIPVQSHLSENPGEIQWVRELCPESACYGDAYDRFGLFGGEDCPTVMAHCVYSDRREQELMKERGVWAAHCPQSNMNLSSGIAPVREFLDRGIKTGLGTDVAGGHSLSMFRAITDAVQASKLYWRLVDQTKKPLALEEAFYMATVGGGSFFEAAGFAASGRFEPGQSMDALVLDDGPLRASRDYTARQRLERLIYFDDVRTLKAKYISGKKVSH